MRRHVRIKTWFIAERTIWRYTIVSRIVRTVELNQEAILVQLRKGVLEYCVMAQLQRAPSYGLQIAADLSQFPALFASEGTLYPLLARLRKQGLVETTWQESTSGPPRRYYKLTKQGEVALVSFKDAWGPFTAGVTKALKETAL